MRKYKYHLLAQPYVFLENIWKRFVATGHGALLLAEHRGEAIGGILFLHWKDTLYYKFNASAADELGYRPNDFVLWNGIQYAKARGLSYLDFGLSDLDQEGLLRYKRKYATEEKVISFLKHAPTSTAAERQLHGLLGKLTGLLTFFDGNQFYRFIQDDTAGVYFNIAEAVTNVALAAGLIAIAAGRAGLTLRCASCP